MAKRKAGALDWPLPADALRAERDRLATIGDLRDRILACGYWCFDKVGLDRTSIELLCDMASISRPSFYRYFDNKQKLLEHIQEIESLKVRTEVRRRIGHHQNFEEMLVQALYLIDRATQKNPYISGFLFSIDAAARSMVREGSHIEHQTQWWGPFVERALSNGNIAPDLTVGGVVAWLNSSMVLLMLQERGQHLPATELKAYIRRYLIRPLLPQCADGT